MSQSNNPQTAREGLREKIEALQFTLMTPAPVTVTLGESKLTDDIMAAIDAYTADEVRRARIDTADDIRNMVEHRATADGYMVSAAALSRTINKYISKLQVQLTHSPDQTEGGQHE